MAAKCSERPLVAEVILLAVFVLNELLILFIDGVICQVHVLVVLVYLRSIGLTGKSGQTFLENVYSQRFIASYQHVDSQIELMPVNKQWVGDIPGYNRQFVHVDIVNIVDELDSSALSSVRWLHDPDVFLAVVLFQLLVVLIELAELVGQDVSVRHEIEVLLPKPLLHSHDVEAESIFPRNFMALREVIYLLVFIQALVQVTLAT